MPNHVSNRVQLKLSDEEWEREEEAFAELQKLMKSNESLFDFNVLIPYPAQYKALDDARSAAEKQGVKWPDLPKDGYNQGGYEWCVKHWGAKWNAYAIGFGYEEVYFCTAWATPLPIWAELSKRFPVFRLEVEYADEDCGRNCGRLTYMNGEQIAHEDMSKSPCAEWFARAIIAEQGEAHNWSQIRELEAKLDELEKRSGTEAAHS